jgi:hypothetical protein
MSATANTDKLGDYFSDYYGPPHNVFVPACEIKVGDKKNFFIHKYYLDDLFDIVPSVSIFVFYKLLKLIIINIHSKLFMFIKISIFF